MQFELFKSPTATIEKKKKNLAQIEESSILPTIFLLIH